MKIYIVGTGGLGGYFGGRLADKYPDLVTFVDHDLAHFQAIKSRGLFVKSVLGDFHIKSAKILKSISEIDDPDWVFFAVKTYDTLGAAQELKNIVTPKTIITTFQNGVLNDYEIKKIINNCYICPGAAYLISSKIKPGIIEQSGGMRKLVFGDRENKLDSRLEGINQLLLGAGLEVSLSNDITKDVWSKFIFIVASSGLTAFYSKTMGEVLNDPKTLKMYESCVNEAISVAKSQNIKIPDDTFQTVMNTSYKTKQDSKTSLSLDIQKNGKNEIETLNGTVVKLAKQHNIDVPVNELIYSSIARI